MSERRSSRRFGEVPVVLATRVGRISHRRCKGDDDLSKYPQE